MGELNFIIEDIYRTSTAPNSEFSIITNEKNWAFNLGSIVENPIHAVS